MKKIKVLHIYKTSIEESFGGIETFIHSLCKEGKNFGVENLVMTLSSNPSKEIIDKLTYKVIQVKQDIFIFQTAFSFQAFFKFRKLVKETDIVHYHFPYPFSDLLHLICRVKKPTILTYHSDIIRQKRILLFYQFLMRRFLNSINCVVATSKNYLVTSKVLSKIAKKVHVIPIGIDINSYPILDLKKNEKFCEKLPENFFVFIGSMRYYKGLKIAIDGIENTKINLALAGIGEIENELKRIVKKRNLKNVFFLGKVSESEKVCLLHKAFGFIFPSHLRAEAFGISLLEAAAFGKPLISCEIGTGTSFVNKNNVTGLVIKPSCPVQLRNAMEFLINNPLRAKEMGENARIRSLKYFNSKETTKKYYALYKKLISNKFTN